MNPFKTVRCLRVHLANDEWNNDFMEKVANHYLNKYKHLHKPEEGEVVVVHVHEHGGWSLGYTLIDNQTTTVYSANDRAYYEGKKKEFREAAYKADWKSIDTEIWRNNPEDKEEIN